MDDLFFATVSELGAGLRRRRFSSMELTRAVLNRLESLGGRYNAVASVLRPNALREARAAAATLQVTQVISVWALIRRERQRPRRGVPRMAAMSSVI